MQFYRKCISTASLSVPTIVVDEVEKPQYDLISNDFSSLLSDLYTLGFRDLNKVNEPQIYWLQGWGAYDSPGPFLAMYWHKDKNKLQSDNFINVNDMPTNALQLLLGKNWNRSDNRGMLFTLYGDRPNYTTAKVFGIESNDGQNGIINSYVRYSATTSCFGFWIIPLKKGFVLIEYRIAPPEAGPITFHTNQFFNNPPLILCKDINEMNSVNTYSSTNDVIATGILIGLYDDISSHMNYINFNSSGAGTQWAASFPIWENHNFIDTLDYKTTGHSPDIAPFASMMNAVPFLDNQFEYTNYNANNCVLIKMPWEDRFLEGIYICVTSPVNDTLEGKFFSFNGRNFLGIHQNLVVELKG